MQGRYRAFGNHQILFRWKPFNFRTGGPKTWDPNFHELIPNPYEFQGCGRKCEGSKALVNGSWALGNPRKKNIKLNQQNMSQDELTNHFHGWSLIPKPPGEKVFLGEFSWCFTRPVSETVLDSSDLSTNSTPPKLGDLIYENLWETELRAPLW